MTALARLSSVDPRAWYTATWSAPFVTHLVLALVIVMAWLLGKWRPGTSGAILFLVSAGIALLLCAAITIPLARSSSARAHGLALGIAGSYAVVLIGGLVYGLWMLAW